MSADVFIDTNVLAYAFDAASPGKQSVALSLIERADFIVSAQVLGELYVTLTRKLTDKVPADVAAQAIARLAVLPVVPTSAALVGGAIGLSIRWQLSYWDALIVGAAKAAGCSTLLTEDLNSGAVIDGVAIVDPFRV